jgi:hypothetical protein
MLNLLFSIFASSSLLSEAKAYTFTHWENANYPNNPIKIHYVSNSCRSVGISDGDMMFYIGEAINNYWGKVSDTTLQLVKGEIIKTSIYRNDNIMVGSIPVNSIVVSCAESLSVFKAESATSEQAGA